MPNLVVTLKYEVSLDSASTSAYRRLHCYPSVQEEVLNIFKAVFGLMSFIKKKLFKSASEENLIND